MSGIIGGAGSKSGIIGETEPFFEEGQFTPTMVLGTSDATVDSNSRGFYTRLGNRIFFQLWFKSTGGSFAGTQLRIGGLPFYIATASQENASEIGMDNGCSMTASSAVGLVGNELPTFVASRGQSRLDAYENDGTNGDYASSNLTSTTFHFRISGQYCTTSGAT